MAPTETLQVALPTLELPTEDGIPLESGWHRSEINLLIESQRHHWRDRTDFYCGGNMVLYYSLEQVRNRDYRGPDFFVVLGVDGSYSREAWVVWEEEGRYPNVIVELLSPTTAEGDKTVKWGLYEQTFRTPEYYCYDPETQELIGWRLSRGSYEPIQPDERGWLWSEQLGLWLGRWEGEYQEEQAIWLRFYTAEGELVLLPAEAERERAEQADRRAEQERQRAEQADQRAERLSARLRALGLEPDEEIER
jgi:Uma2 family endonuclease